MPRDLSTAATALSITPASPLDAELALDDLVKLACRGDEDAQAVLGYELYPLLVLEACSYIDGCRAEEIAHDVLEMINAGRIRARTKPRQTLATVLRIAGMHARDRARE